MVDFRAIEDALIIDRKAGKIPRITDIYEIMKGENAYFSSFMLKTQTVKSY